MGLNVAPSKLMQFPHLSIIWFLGFQQVNYYIANIMKGIEGFWNMKLKKDSSFPSPSPPKKRATTMYGNRRNEATCRMRTFAWLFPIFTNRWCNWNNEEVVLLQWSFVLPIFKHSYDLTFSWGLPLDYFWFVPRNDEIVIVEQRSLYNRALFCQFSNMVETHFLWGQSLYKF